jgi:hypothetical protein
MYLKPRYWKYSSISITTIEVESSWQIQKGILSAVQIVVGLGAIEEMPKVPRHIT